MIHINPILILLCGLLAQFSSLFSYDYSTIQIGFFTTAHILKVDPKYHEIVLVRADGDEIRRETVLALAERYGAGAAINGGFWKIDGTPSGILKIRDQWHGTPEKVRGAIGWADYGETVLMDRVITSCDLEECINPDWIEVIPMTNPPSTTSNEWKKMDYILGGVPLLVQKGNVNRDFFVEGVVKSFIYLRHPRTAVGIDQNGNWMFVVIDGSFWGLLGGMTMRELAEFMERLGCVKALNLDGGGSSTMVIEGAVVNQPCGEIDEKGQNVRAVSDAILIY